MSHRQRGFSLLELIVVLTLIGLLATLALPNVQRLYASAQRATERDLILKQLDDLPSIALLRQRDYVVYGTDATEAPALSEASIDATPYPLEVPEGWSVALDRPLVVRASGVCLGAELTLSHPDSAVVRADMRPPYCAVRASRAAQAS